MSTAPLQHQPQGLSRFANLPVELLNLIFTVVRSEDLFAVVCTCSLFCKVAKPYLYEKVVIRNQRALRSFARTLLREPDSAEKVRHFIRKQSGTDPNSEEAAGAGLGIQILQKLSNIETLELSADFSYFNWDEWHNILDNAASGQILRQLKKCSLSFPREQNGRFPFEYIEDIFCLSSLENLTIRHTTIHASDLSRREQDIGRSIKRLALKQSEIDPEVLSGILSVTWNLEDLVIALWPGNVDPYSHFGDVPGVFEPVSKTLKSLVLSKEFAELNTWPIDLESMVALRYVAAEADDWFGCGTNEDDIAQLNALQLQTILPPNLEIMRIGSWGMLRGGLYDEESAMGDGLMPTLVTLIGKKETLVPSLKEIQLDAKIVTELWELAGFAFASTFRDMCQNHGVSVIIIERDDFLKDFST